MCYRQQTIRQTSSQHTIWHCYTLPIGLVRSECSERTSCPERLGIGLVAPMICLEGEAAEVSRDGKVRRPFHSGLPHSAAGLVLFLQTRHTTRAPHLFICALIRYATKPSPCSDFCQWLKSSKTGGYFSKTWRKTWRNSHVGIVAHIQINDLCA